MTTTNPTTAAPSALPPITLFPAHRHIHSHFSHCSETLSFVQQQLRILLNPFCADQRADWNMTAAEVDAIGIHLLFIENLVVLASEQFDSEMAKA